MDERPDSSQQLMDILLVMDEKGTLQAVSGVKDGELQTKNPLEDNNDLLRVDRHGDMFSNFFSNLWSQLKDPTRFHFFRVPEEEVQRVAADFRQRESQSVKTGEPLLAQYEVQPPVQAQQQTQAGQQQQPEGTSQQSAGQTEQNPQYKYHPEDIDWNSLAALGVQREQIEGNGMLDQMLRGFQTDKTVRVHFHFDGISHSNDSQLSLKPGTDGRLTVCSHGSSTRRRCRSSSSATTSPTPTSRCSGRRATWDIRRPSPTGRANRSKPLSAATSRPTSWSPSRSPRSISRRRRTGIPSPRTR